MFDPNEEPTYAVADSETSGLFNYAKPADADGQPRLASLGLITLGPNLSIDTEREWLIKPDGWEMNPEASAVNGLTMERLNDDGVPVRDVLEEYVKLVDEGRVIVGFNTPYDLKVMRGELRRAGMEDRYKETYSICIMRAATGYVKIPRANGNGYKFPKLVEACEHFKITNHQAHSALSDAHATALMFRFLTQLKAKLDPEAPKLGK
jgi:DNA polymerase III subunit epsilon